MPREVDEVREFTRQEKEILEEFDKALDRATDLAVRDMLFYLDVEMKRIFRDVIDEFYADYTPQPDGYERHQSLYNLFQTQHFTGENARLEFWFEPSEMTPFRSGYDGEDGLYDQVFRKGWHGGAGSGPGHPSPSTPYWRTPHPYYTMWGREAAVANVSPLDRFYEKMHEAEPVFSEEFGRLIDLHANEILGI